MVLDSSVNIIFGGGLFYIVLYSKYPTLPFDSFPDKDELRYSSAVEYVISFQISWTFKVM